MTGIRGSIDRYHEGGIIYYRILYENRQRMVTIDYKKAVFLQAFGAAETVTGSKLLLRTPSLNIMIDCGLFQGLKSLRAKNWQYPPINPTKIDDLLITHAHLDHTGYIPLLVKYGYKGKIYMSAPTQELCEIILRDSAKLQEEDAYKANLHGYTKHKPAEPLYTVADVEIALKQFVTVATNKEYQLNNNISFQFFPAGHITGACSIKLNCYGKSIVFSGDLGRQHTPYLPSPQAPGEADYLVMEATYGDRLHEGSDAGEQLAAMVREVISQGGNLLIPCFAVGRAQELLLLLYQLKQERKIPIDIPIFLDSPMASLANKVLLHYPAWTTLTSERWQKVLSSITINKDFSGTEKIIKQKNSKIILAGSGMLTGGRALEYLKHYLGDDRNIILLVGFQAVGTRGRALLNGAYELKIHGQYYPVIAKVREITGLSAHADQQELINWLNSNHKTPEKIFLNHGEPCALEALRVKIQDTLQSDVIILKQDQTELLYTV